MPCYQLQPGSNLVCCNVVFMSTAEGTGLGNEQTTALKFAILKYFINEVSRRNIKMLDRREMDCHTTLEPVISTSKKKNHCPPNAIGS